MTRTTQEILAQLEDLRKNQEAQLLAEGNEVLKWEILESKHGISAMQARGLARSVNEEANELRKQGVQGLNIPKRILAKETFVKFSEDFPILFKFSLSPNPKVLECVELMALAQHRCDTKHITEQEKVNIQQHLIFDYAPLLAGNMGTSTSSSSGPKIEEIV